MCQLTPKPKLANSLARYPKVSKARKVDDRTSTGEMKKSPTSQRYIMIELFVFIVGFLLGIVFCYGKCVEELLTWNKSDFVAWKEQALTSIKKLGRDC